MASSNRVPTVQPQRGKGGNTMGTEKICVVVKTYPSISKTYRELVCCGGINEQGQWRRLYPLPFRRLPDYRRFQKYSWITADLTPDNDGRPESFRPNIDSIKIETGPLPANDWLQRMELIYRSGVSTLEEIRDAKERKQLSMATVRAGEVDGMRFRPADPQTEQKWRDVLSQPQLPGIDQESFYVLKPLPYTFQYVFRCEDEHCSGHEITTLDWEVAALFHNLKERGMSDMDAANGVCEAFQARIDRPDRALHFFVGTTVQFGTWVIGGVAYPPKKTIEKLMQATLDL